MHNTLASGAQSDAHTTGYYEVAGSISTVSGNICADWSWNSFYGHPLPSADSRKGVVNSWRKNVHKYCLTAKRTKSARKKSGYVKLLDITITGYLGRKTLTQSESADYNWCLFYIF